MNRDKRAAQPSTRHQSENFQRDSRCMGDRVRQDDVWRNYSGKDNSNSNENMDCSKYNNKRSYNNNNNNSYNSKPYRVSNGSVSDHRYDNRHRFPPREPRNASRQFQEQQPQPRSKRGGIWRPKSDDGRSCDNNSYNSRPYRGSNGCVTDYRHDNRHLQPQPRSKRSDFWRPKSADERHGQRQEWALKQEQNLGPGKREGVQQGGRQVHSLEMLQQQSALAQALLPHWVRMKDMMWMSALRKNDTKEVSTTTEAGMAANKHKKPSGPPPKPVTTLAARVISRDGPFGPSSTIELVPAMGSNGGTPLGSCCVNLVFESFGMIGITPNQENPEAYDIKRTDNYQLTAEQKLRLRNAIERSEDGQVLAALDLAIQQIRTEIDQKSPLMLEMSPDRSPRHSPGRQEVKPQQLQQIQKEAAVFDPAVWTWRTPTPTSPVSEGNDSDLDSWDKTRTFATKSNITSNAEGGRKSWKSSSNAGDRSESDFPGTRSSTTDFSQPPFGRKKM